MKAEPGIAGARSRDRTTEPDLAGSPPPETRASGAPGPSAAGPSAERSARKQRRNKNGPSLGEAASTGFRHVLELRDYVLDYLETRADRAAVELRRKTSRLAILAALAVAGTTLLIASMLRVVRGLAEGLTILFQGRAWLGDLLAGLLLAGGMAVGTAVFLARREKKELKRHVAKYERLHQEHRARHGRHVADQHASPHD